MILFCLLLAFPGTAQAQGFIDTTTGDVEEAPEYFGMDADDANTREAQSIINKFKRGRLSSNKDRNSRFSGTLEFHDSNQDGVVDHDVDPGSGGLEGELRGLVKGSGSHLDEIAKKAVEEANKGNCQKPEGGRTTSKDGGPTRTTCHNMSGIIVDTGAAHGGDKEGYHRTYKLSDEAMEIAERIGKQYGERALDDIMKLYQETYGDRLGGQDKVAAVDLKRSEAAWLEQQKETVYDRQWKLLRYARLAGYDGAEERVAGTRGKNFMHELESKLANGATEQELAEMISVESTLEREALGFKDNQWVALDSLSTQEEKDAAIQAATRRLNLDEETTIVTLGDLSTASEEERRKAADNVREYVAAEPDDDEKERRQKIAGCLEANSWCHTDKTALIASKGDFEAAEKARFTAVSGDPGEVFEDTRELIAQKMAEIQTMPVNKIKAHVTNHDFNEQTHPEFFKELDQKIEEVRGLAEGYRNAKGEIVGADPDNYDLDTMSFRELTGIRKGLNDTFDDSLPDLNNLVQKIGGPGGGGAGPTAGGGFGGTNGPVSTRRTPSSFY